MTHSSQLPVTVHQALSVYETDAVEIVNKTLQELTPGPEQLEIWFLEGCERFKEATNKSYTKAAAWWRQAAEFGHVESQFNLAGKKPQSVRMQMPRMPWASVIGGESGSNRTL
jgi:TPR repeat protein